MGGRGIRHQPYRHTRIYFLYLLDKVNMTVVDGVKCAAEYGNNWSSIHDGIRLK